MILNNENWNEYYNLFIIYTITYITSLMIGSPISVLLRYTSKDNQLYQY